MDVWECIKTRRSVRNFLNRPVNEDQITQILEAGTYAPSSGNVQNWEFIIVKDKKRKKEIATACLGQNWMTLAPVLIIVCSKKDRIQLLYGKKSEKFHLENVAACIQNMLLMTHNLGLASCWVGAMDEDAIKEILSLPESVDPIAILPVGYAAEKTPAPPRVGVEYLTYQEQYGKTWGKKVDKLLR